MAAKLNMKTQVKIARMILLQERARRQQDALDRTRRAWEQLAEDVMKTTEWEETADRLGVGRKYDFGDVLA